MVVESIVFQLMQEDMDDGWRVGVWSGSIRKTVMIIPDIKIFYVIEGSL